MTIAVILLALASTVRPTSLAAIYALLSTRRAIAFMTVYVITGLAVTTGLGLLVVLALHGAGVPRHDRAAKAGAEIIAGIILLVLGTLAATGRISGRSADDAPDPGTNWMARMEDHLTLPRAALLGPATHIPGIFYLVALNLIATHGPRRGIAVAEVVVFNLIWFAIPIAALALSVVRPSAAAQLIGAINGWVAQHSRVILLTVAFALGGFLLVQGLLNL